MAARRAHSSSWASLVLLPAGPGATGAAGAVVLRDDRGADALDLLVFLLDLLGVGLRIRIQPRLAVLQRVHDLLLLLGIHLLAEALVLAGALRGGAHGVDVAVEGVLGVDAFLDLLVLVGKLLRLLDHLFDLLLRQSALVVRDGDLFALARGLVLPLDLLVL